MVLIRKMDDTFWFKLAELSQLGKLEYFIRRVPESGEIRQFPYLHGKSRSALFTLIQDAISSDMLNGSTNYLGTFIVKWKYTASCEKFLSSAILALKNLYYLNKALDAKQKR